MATPKRILVVEDDDAIRDAIVELMTEEGFEVASARHGSQGLSHLQQAEDLPHLILVDLMMPVMNGFEFCQRKKEDPRLAAIPTMVMSADGHVAEKQSQTSAQAYIKKPVDIDDLIERVNAALSSHL